MECYSTIRKDNLANFLLREWNMKEIKLSGVIGKERKVSQRKGTGIDLSHMWDRQKYSKRTPNGQRQHY